VAPVTYRRTHTVCQNIVEDGDNISSGHAGLYRLADGVPHPLIKSTHGRFGVCHRVLGNSNRAATAEVNYSFAPQQTQRAKNRVRIYSRRPTDLVGCWQSSAGLYGRRQDLSS